MTTDELSSDLPELTAVLTGADHVDVKTVILPVQDHDPGPTLREFAAGALSYRPAWVQALFAVRVVLATMLRLDQAPVAGRARPLQPEDIGFTPGSRVGFFTVVAADQGRFLLLRAADTHLTGYLALVVDPPAGGMRRYRAITVVRYHRFTGPVYFSVVRPFHHLVVAGMTRAGSRQAQNRNSPAPNRAR